MKMVIEPGPQGVQIVRGAPNAHLTDLDGDDVRAALRTYGALWFRDFSTGPQHFFDFIRQFAVELITLNTPERVRHPEVPEIQSVTGGSFALNFHSEMGHLPGRPEFLSFWCETPASKGGDTGLVDGVALWNALPKATQEIFLNRKIRYVMRIPHAWWTDRIGSDNPADIAPMYENIEDTEYELLDDGTLVSRWTTSAVFRPMFSDQLAFVSNIFPYVVPGLTFSFDDGEPISDSLQQELQAHALALTASITWHAGEVVLFDNTRWLHGRTEVGGLRRRRVHMLQGYLDFAPEGAVRLKNAHHARATTTASPSTNP